MRRNVLALLIVVTWGLAALAQVAPTPFTVPTLNVVGFLSVADGGNIGGPVSVLGNLTDRGVCSIDAGVVGSDLLVFTGPLADAGGLEIGGSATGCISDWSSASGFFAIYPTACSATNNTNFLLASNVDETNVQLNFGSAGTLYFKTQGGSAAWGTLSASAGLSLTSGSLVASAGSIAGHDLVVNTGPSITGLSGGGQCTINTGTTCTATTTGSTVGSVCWFAINGSSAVTTAIGCACSAGNGTTAITCPTTSATFNVFTMN